MSALSLVPGINESYQMGLFQILAAILHLGNVEVKDRDADSSIIPVSVTCPLEVSCKANREA